MAAEPEKRPLEAEDGDSNVSYRPAAPARGSGPLRSQGVAPAGPQARPEPVRESDLAGGKDEAGRREKILKTERYGPTSGKL
jgi:hypothetical protein